MTLIINRLYEELPKIKVFLEKGMWIIGYIACNIL